MASMFNAINALRTYKSDTYPDDYSQWYCYVDKEIYDTNELYESYGYTSKYEIYSSGLFVELPKVDITECEKQYLRLRLGKDFKKWDSILDNEFDIEFRIYVERNFLTEDWVGFEEKILSSTLLQWCSRYGIVLDR